MACIVCSETVPQRSTRRSHETGPDRVAEHLAGLAQAAVGWLQTDVVGIGPEVGGDGYHDAQPRGAEVVRIHRYHQHRAAPGLLVAANRVQVSQPHLAAAWWPHALGLLGLQAVQQRPFQDRLLGAPSRPPGGILPQLRVIGIALP